MAGEIGLTETAIWTGLARNLDEQGQALIKATGKVWKTGDQGAATAMVAAFDPKLNGMCFRGGGDIADNIYVDVPGGYLADCQLAPAAEFATDPKIAERLWGLSEKLVGEKFNLSGK